MATPWEARMPHRFVLESADPDVAYEAIRAAYRTARIAASGPHRRIRVAQQVLGATELHRVSFPLYFHATAPPLGMLVVGRVRAGTMTYRDHRRSDRYVTGDLYLLGDPGCEYDTAVYAVDAAFARIDYRLINQIAEAESGTPVRFTGSRPISAALGRRWSHTFDFARRNAGTAAGAPLLADSVSRVLAAAALSAFPSNVLVDPTIEDRHDAHPAALRRAIAYIESGAHLTISLADIADAAHVSMRALRLAFRRHLDTTPVAYLRRVRLAHAHRDLFHAAPGTVGVAEIAARWGFAGLGRFTDRYHAAYGCTPGHTLHRR
ncbi:MULTISPECIES: helix-turn-helix transcriptional regulator [Catenuloplanes]|uniref:AraC-like DNA-binding protein n=1 Tax=Catenuloplanes niger TaxID=587534 RepID=A0AAE3ZZP3_9ACTN|nr:helix-turn-helix transcriptional regulator [Catenuloplanes niger]MDR7327950.1 AraC-like DNA-binding protein [Catenuloplanes niger]